MRRGKNPPFKMMGSSPYKENEDMPDPTPPPPPPDPIPEPDDIPEPVVNEDTPDPVEAETQEPPKDAEIKEEIEESKDIEKTIEQKEEDEQEVKEEVDEMSDEEKMRFIENYEREHLSIPKADESTMYVDDPRMTYLEPTNHPKMPTAVKVFKYATQARQLKDQALDKMKDGTTKNVLNESKSLPESYLKKPALLINPIHSSSKVLRFSIKLLTSL